MMSCIVFLLIWTLCISFSSESYSRSECFVRSGGEGDADGNESEGDGDGYPGNGYPGDGYPGDGYVGDPNRDFPGDSRRGWGSDSGRGEYGEERDEMENEGDEEEFEYGDRKKRASFGLRDSGEAGNITGRLTCRTGTHEMIHVTKVVVGVSSAGWCRSRDERCQEEVANHPLMFSCEGEDESCEIFVEKTQIPGCRRPINFVLVTYECLPDDSRLDICHFAEAGRDDSVIVTSPAYPWVPLMHDGEYLTCECEISTDDRSVITMEYIQSEMSGQLLACDDEFLLVEKRDPRNKRKFKVEDEICGTVRRDGHSLDDSLIRLTYMAGKPNNTDSKRGFLAKFKAMSRGRRPSRIQIKCEELSDDDNVVTEFGRDVVLHDASFGRPRVVSAMPNSKANGGYSSNTNPQPQDIQTPASQTTSGPVIGAAAGAGAVRGGAVNEDAPPTEESSGGVLGAVVACLVSIIVIMGSLAVYFIHKRKQRKLKERAGKGSIRSQNSWYRDPVYTDPVYTTASQPPGSRDPSENTAMPVNTLRENVAPAILDTVTSPEVAPSLPPKAPPRRKRQNMDEVVYDNASLTIVGARSSGEQQEEGGYDNITITDV